MNVLAFNGTTYCARYAEVTAVDEAIDFCHRLRQEVGSYALMVGLGTLHYVMYA
jgi:hypothetical protein